MSLDGLGKKIKVSLVSFSITLLTLWFPVIAESSDFRIYEIKAGFIYNFTKYIKWPQTSVREMQSSGLSFCIAGRNPFGNSLKGFAETLKEEKAQRLVVRKITKSEEASSCHILFIEKSAASKVKDFIGQVEQQPVLTIGDTRGLAEKGVTFNFFERNNNLAFQINPQSAKAAGLWISSDLLKLGQIVQGERP